MLLLVKKLWNFEKVEIFSGKTLTNFLWEKLDFWLFFGGGGQYYFRPKVGTYYYICMIYISHNYNTLNENRVRFCTPFLLCWLHWDNFFCMKGKIWYFQAIFAKMHRKNWQKIFFNKCCFSTLSAEISADTKKSENISEIFHFLTQIS